MPDLFAPADLATLIGSDVDTARATLLLELVTGHVTDAAGGRVFDPVPPSVKAVALDVAVRAYDNPKGFASESLGAYSYSRDSASTRGGVYLTPDEKRTIRRAAGRTGLGTIELVRPLGVSDLIPAIDAYGHVSPDLISFPTDPVL